MGKNRKPILVVVLMLTTSLALSQDLSGWWSKAQTTLRQIAKDHAIDSRDIEKTWAKQLGLMQSRASMAIQSASKAVRDANLEQKKNVLIQLWKVRKSLTLAKALNPVLLHELTGMDTAQIAVFELKVTVLYLELQRQLHPAKSPAPEQGHGRVSLATTRAGVSCLATSLKC